MILIVDTNTLWRRKPFEALSAWIPVLGLAPRDFISALRGPRKRQVSEKLAGYEQVSVVMIPGWASRFPSWAACRLWRAGIRFAQRAGTRICALVVTSPHYVRLAVLARNHVPVFYYCSDDYSTYAGWGGRRILSAERELVRLAAHSVFVSQSLADRAINEYGVPVGRITVSPNATSNDFLDPVESAVTMELIGKFSNICRPIAGIVGTINERLDFDLLLRCADAPGSGTLVFVGPITKGFDDQILRQLKTHPRCVFVGERPHAELRTWMRALDVALIPYRESQFNRACSPMRLFDHLAAGKPIVATDACEQVKSFNDVVRVTSSATTFVAAVREELSKVGSNERRARLVETARENTWSKRAENLMKVLEKELKRV